MDSNTVLGGWYFNGAQLFVPSGGGACEQIELSDGEIFLVRGANGRRYPGVINLYLCGTFTTNEEGVYSCIMMNSSMMEQTVRVGVYFSGRSESLDMYPHHLIVNHLSSLYTAAPMIDPPLSSTVTAAVGSPLTLSCTSRGSPPDTFTWRKDISPIVQSTSIITVTHTSTSAVFRADYSINSVTTSDSGTYTCTVTNLIGSDSETITVITFGELFYYTAMTNINEKCCMLPMQSFECKLYCSKYHLYACIFDANNGNSKNIFEFDYVNVHG